jgi:outer membrane receptor protein involved in Fe transport
MKKLVFLILVSGIIFTSAAQNPTSVSGKVIDKSNSLTLPGATVAFSQKGSDRLLTGTITDEEGRFILFGLPKGEYSVSVSFIGYKTVEKAFLIGELNKNFDLGRFEMEPSSETIGEVTVAGQKTGVDAGLDKKSYTVADNLAQSGGSIMDAMKTLPGVTFDQEGKVILRGSDKVAVLIDGKQSSLTGFGNQKGLDNIPASNIERIEIINNPSAKYDASGMAGIINIIYKKSVEKGFNGDAGLSFGVGTLGRAKADLPSDLGSYAVNPKIIPSLNLNYRNSRIQAFLQSEAMFQRMLPNNEFTTRTYADGRITASQVPENRSQEHFIEKGGINWFINSRNSLQVSAIYDWEIHIDTARVPFIDMNSGERYRYWGWREQEITGFMNGTVNYRHDFPEPGHQLNVNAQFTQGWENENYMLRDSSPVRIGTDSTHILAIENTTSVAADYVRPLSSGRLEAGSKLQWRRLPVEYTTARGTNSIIYPGIGDWSYWGENLYAGYLNYVLEKTKFDVEAGLRAEETEVFYNLDPANIYYLKNDSYRYFELFPNVRLTWKLNSRNSFSAFFNRRIDRPGEPELRVFPKYDDPELLKVGNPYLRPQKTASGELAYRHRWTTGSVFLSGYYRMIDDPFMRIYSIDQTNSTYDIINKIYHNTGKASNTGFEVLLSQQVNDRIKLSASANGYRNVIYPFEGMLLFPYERPFSIERSEDYSFDAKMTGQMTLPASWQLQLSYVYYSPKTIPQGRQQARSSLDFGIKKVFWKGKGELTLSASDLFKTFSIRQEIAGDGFTALYENYYETQVIRAAFRYKF